MAQSSHCDGKEVRPIVGLLLCRREAAAKLNANRAIIVRDCTNNSGIFSTEHRGINGAPPPPAAARCLLCTQLPRFLPPGQRTRRTFVGSTVLR